MLTDRQRVEAGIIPALIYGVCFNMKDIQQTQEQRDAHKKVCTAALEGMKDPVIDLDPKRQGQILRRSERAYLELAKILDDSSNVQAMMAIYYLLEELLREERLNLYEGSQFADAMNILLNAVDEYWSEEKLDKAAQKRARQMRETLRKEGYFR